MFTIVVGVLCFMIGWIWSRRFAKWQLNRSFIERGEMTAQIADEVICKLTQEAMSYGWWAARNGDSINYKVDDEGHWSAGFFQTIQSFGQEHVLYMKEYTPEGGLVNISETVPQGSLHQRQLSQIPENLPEGY